MADEEQRSVFGTFFLLFFIFIVFLIGAFLCAKFLSISSGVFGSNSLAYRTSNTIYNTVFGLFDNSFLFIAVIALLADGISAMISPSVARGIANIFLLFATAYVFVFFNTFTYTLNAALDANTLLPNTFFFFSNHYTLFLIIALSVFGIITNFRRTKKEDHSEEQEYEDVEE